MEFYQQEDPNADITELRSRAETSLNRLRCFEYASCWNMSVRENALMWKAYAPQGIAIRSTIRKFRRAKQQEGQDLSIRAQRIEYADHWKELQKRGYAHNGIPLNRLFLHTKRKAFKSEREVRFRVAPAFPFLIGADGKPRSPDPSTCPVWFPVKFGTLNWIEEVVAESSIPRWAVETIQKLTAEHRIKFRGSEI